MGSDLEYYQENETLRGALAQAEIRNVEIVATSVIRRSAGVSAQYSTQLIPRFPKGIFSGIAVFGAHLNRFFQLEPFAARLRELAGGTPVVSFNIPLEGIPGILPANRAGIAEIVRHLVEHHQISRYQFLIRRPEGRRLSEWEERLEAFVECMKNHGIPSDCFSVSAMEGDEPDVNFQSFVTSQGGGKIAVVCQDDDTALAAYGYCMRHRIPVGGALSITGFSDFEFEVDQFEIPITTFRMPVFDMGRRSVDWLLDLLKSPNQAANHVEVPGRLILRSTCGCFMNGRENQAPEADRAADPVEFSNRVVFELRSGDLSTEVAGRGNAVVRELASRNRLQVIRAREERRIIAESLIARLSESFEYASFYQLLSDCLLGLGVRRCQMILLETDERLPEGGSEFAFNPAERVYVFDGVSGAMLSPAEPLESWVYFFGEGAGSSASRFILPMVSNNHLVGFLAFEPGKAESHLLHRLVWKAAAALFSIRLLRLREETIVKLDEVKGQLEEYGRKMQSLSQTDEMTGLKNRRGFIASATPLLRVAIRHNEPYGILFVDMDGLKSINDTHGHAEGDAAIRKVAECLGSSFRGSDILARFGGDEFAVFAPRCEAEAAALVIQRLRESLENVNRELRKPKRHSVIVGLHLPVPGENRTLEELLDHSDDLLYEEKKGK
ncbi:MAG: GGDEF domain-containing protein [Spirochaetia bacterium]|nr:GGDEF domain-containing protein [Spirochaetia bacterium]